MLCRIADWLEHWLAPASRMASNIGVSMIILLTLLTVFNVLKRFISGSAFTPMKELSEYALSVLVFLTLPYCAIKGAHIVIDILTIHLSNHSQAVLGSVMGFISLIMCGLFTWQTFIRGMWAFGSGQNSTILGVWLFPFVFIASLGFLLMGLVFLMQWLRAVKASQAPAVEELQK
jgi:TRAP-type C4-dicarboxylate transport system permease small subunit